MNACRWTVDEQWAVRWTPVATRLFIRSSLGCTVNRSALFLSWSRSFCCAALYVTARQYKGQPSKIGLKSKGLALKGEVTLKPHMGKFSFYVQENIKTPQKPKLALHDNLVISSLSQCKKKNNNKKIKGLKSSSQHLTKVSPDFRKPRWLD